MSKSKPAIGVVITDTHLSENTIELNFSVWAQAIELCEQMSLSVLYHMGDVFTSRKGQPEIVLNAFKSILDIATSKHIHIVVIAGNHDRTSYVSESSFLDAFAGETLRVVSPIGSITKKDLGYCIHFVPYYDEELKYASYLEQVKINPELKNILLTHVAIDGIRNNSGSKVENAITQDLFDQFDLVLVGHYHNRQIVGKRKHIVYTGSAYQANFGEDSDKGATIIYADATYAFVPFEFPKYNTIELASSEINSKLVNKIQKNKGEDNLRIRITDDLDESKKPLLIELQQFAKVEVTKQSFAPVDVVQSESVVIDDILGEFDIWSKDIEDRKYGRKLLSSKI